MIRKRDFIKLTGIVFGGMAYPLPLPDTIQLENMTTGRQYDVIIVGGSYAGLAAGMALGRAIRKVLIIDSGNPCNRQSPHSHNFLTNDGKAPGEITRLAREQVRLYDTVDFLDAFVTIGSKTESGFQIQVQTGETFMAAKLIFATGIKDSMPDMPGFAACWGITVLHCPYCHGYEVRYQQTGILATGDDGFDLATLISNWTNDITLYTNGPAFLTAQQLNRLEMHKISISEKEIERLDHRNGYIESIFFKDGTKAPVKTIYAKLPFVQHSTLPQSLGCELTPDGYIKTDTAQKTSVPGIYACGDNSSRMRTVASAVAMGTKAGMMLNKDLVGENF